MRNEKRSRGKKATAARPGLSLCPPSTFIMSSFKNVVSVNTECRNGPSVSRQISALRRRTGLINIVHSDTREINRREQELDSIGLCGRARSRTD